MLHHGQPHLFVVRVVLRRCFVFLGLSVVDARLLGGAGFESTREQLALGAVGGGGIMARLIPLGYESIAMLH